MSPSLQTKRSAESKCSTPINRLKLTHQDREAIKVAIASQMQSKGKNIYTQDLLYDESLIHSKR